MSCHQTVQGHRPLSHWRQNLVRFSHFSRECRVNTPTQIWEIHDSGQMPWGIFQRHSTSVFWCAYVPNYWSITVPCSKECTPFFLYDTFVCNLLLFVQINNSWFLIPESGYTDGLAQDSSNCSALAMELLQSPTKLPILSCIEAYSCKHRADYSITPFKVNGSRWGFIVHVIQRIALHIELGLTKQWKFCDAKWRHISSLPFAKSML